MGGGRARSEEGEDGNGADVSGESHWRLATIDRNNNTRVRRPSHTPSRSLTLLRVQSYGHPGLHSNQARPLDYMYEQYTFLSDKLWVYENSKRPEITGGSGLARGRVNINDGYL